LAIFEVVLIGNSSMHSIKEILKYYWGYDEFRPLQEDIIQSVLDGYDTLTLLPTGGGKSICFQVPALALQGVCIVVTPLIALMKDQVEQLKKRKIPAVAIYSGMNNFEIDITLDNCIYGNIKFLYVSPERLKTEIFIERVKRMKVSLLAIDEAHCISQWGYDFRPPYLEIAHFRQYIPGAKIIALTASATKPVVEDILEKLEFKNPKVFRKSFTRVNLSYSSIYEENKNKKLLEILKKVPGTSIVYVRSRKRTKEIATLLQRQGISADYYHAGLTNDIRSKKQEYWINNKIRVIVATNAFGMGIDKPDVRTVIHMDIPDSLEAYYQEAGRAGRDGKMSYAVILFDKRDLTILSTKVLQEFPEISFIKKVYQSLANYFKIAVGSSNMASFDFNIEDFQKTFNLTPVSTYFSIKKLEEEGFIQLNESFYAPSKLFIKMDNKTLYEYIIANPEHEHFIKTLLRMYGGELFTNFHKISEFEIGRNLQLDTRDILRILNLLHQKGIIIYEPMKDKPQLTFITPRFDAAKLPLNEKAMEARKQLGIQKMEAIIGYTEHLFKCRNSMIIEYFDETVERDCGKCDNCLNKKKTNKLEINHQENRDKILNKLKEAPCTLDEINTFLEPISNNDFVSTIRSMISTGELRYCKDGKVELGELD
jgi:ATP-dependent DNA helicase RecQ